MKITVEQLRELGACDEGIRAFQDAFGDVYENEWTLDEQLLILKSPLKMWLGQAVHMNLVPLWSMQGADLRRADLHRADLQGANLQGADLQGANLQGARGIDNAKTS